MSFQTDRFGGAEVVPFPRRAPGAAASHREPLLPVLIVLRVRRQHTPRPFTTWGGAPVPYLVLGIYAVGMIYTAVRLLHDLLTGVFALSLRALLSFFGI